MDNPPWAGRGGPAAWDAAGMTSLAPSAGALVLDPDVLVLDRLDGSVQLGWGPDTATVIVPPDEIDAFEVRVLLGLLDGSLSYEHVLVAATARGLPVEAVRVLLDELVEAGSVRTCRVPSGRSSSGRSSCTAVPSSPPSVRLFGAGPLAHALVPHLALWDTRWLRSPPRIDDAGLSTRIPDCAVLADTQIPDPRLVQAVMRLRIPHLLVRVRDGRGVIGPFVVPGRTSCLRCADLTRTDADPSWPRLAAQLSGREGRAERAVIAATVAAAVAQLDMFFARTHPAPGTPREDALALDRTIEWDLRSTQLVTRRWPRHPHCDCTTIFPSVQA